MKMEAINVLESLETLIKNIDIKKHDIIIVSHPDNFKPIDDNIEWILKETNIADGIILGYNKGILKLTNDTTIKVISSKYINPKKGFYLCPASGDRSTLFRFDKE